MQIQNLGGSVFLSKLIKNILDKSNELEKKYKYQKVFEKEANEAKDAFEKQQKNRKEKLDDLKNKNEKITEEVIKDLNKEEKE